MCMFVCGRMTGKRNTVTTKYAPEEGSKAEIQNERAR